MVNEVGKWLMETELSDEARARLAKVAADIDQILPGRAWALWSYPTNAEGGNPGKIVYLSNQDTPDGRKRIFALMAQWLGVHYQRRRVVHPGTTTRQ